MKINVRVDYSKMLIDLIYAKFYSPYKSCDIKTIHNPSTSVLGISENHISDSAECIRLNIANDYLFIRAMYYFDLNCLL